MPNFNAFMHRRNIFRKEPDFKNLACDYQELRPFMAVGSKNRLKFDFKNPDALRALTCALVHRYFQKSITLPPDRLIPAVPQRLNYICWIEDLVRLVEVQMPDLGITGIDIGTGASCIFPILTCHRNPSWSFLGVEADSKSYSMAAENVQRNFMEDRIRMVRISTEDTLSDVLCRLTTPVTFIMCNPPFFEEEYGVTLEMNPNVSSGRLKSSANTSDKCESVVSGGEIAFVGHMLEQSRFLKEEVFIYTSMLGKKQSLIHFKQTLSSLGDDHLSWTWAELCQGKTIRYAIAWTFKPGLDLTKAPPLRHGKNKSWKFKLLKRMPKRDCQLELLENGEYLKNLVTRDLLIAKARVTRQSNQIFEMLIKTNERTWTNQRRRRREQLNKLKQHQAGTTCMGPFSGALALASSSSASGEDQTAAKSTFFMNEIGNSLNAAIDTSAQMICDTSDSSTVSIDGFKSTAAQATETTGNARCGSTSHHLGEVGGGGGGGGSCGSSDMSCSNHANAKSNHNNDNGSSIASNSSSSSSSGSDSTTNAAAVSNNIIGSLRASVGGLGVGSKPTLAAGFAMNQTHGDAALWLNSRKRKNPSSCSSSPSRICPSPNDELTDDFNQSTDNSDRDLVTDDNTNDTCDTTKRPCLDGKRSVSGCGGGGGGGGGSSGGGDDDSTGENMDDAYDYLLSCRISLSRVCHDLYFELKLEHPCTAASDAYDLFQYFRNKLSEK